MMNRQIVEETVDLIRTALNAGMRANMIINNRAVSNAPLIAQMISEGFLNTAVSI